MPPPPLAATEFAVEVAAPTPARPYIPCAVSANAMLGIKALEDEEATDEAELASGAGDAGGRGDDDESDSGDECTTN